jgi:hypothetical protein
MPAERPWLLGLSDLVLGSAPQSHGLGYDWTEAIQASIDLTKDVAPVVVAAVKKGKKKGKKKHGGGGAQKQAAPPSPEPAAPSTIPTWAPVAAIGATAVVGVLLLTRRPAPAPAAPIPARNPRRRSRHVR